jgi:hypothetical protein
VKPFLYDFCVLLLLLLNCLLKKLVKDWLWLLKSGIVQERFTAQPIQGESEASARFSAEFLVFVEETSP